MAYRKTRPSRKKARKPVFKRRLTYGAITIAIVIAVFFAYSLLKSSNPISNGQTHSRTAALVDQLSISDTTRNDTFRRECLSILNNSGFDFAYYSDVTVDFYRNLPLYDYSLIVFRVHAAAITNTTWVGMFTSEIYNESKHHDLLVDNQLAIATIFEGNKTYFGITHLFVQKSMIGTFKDTTIIMMGCDGLKYTTMADAFIKKGAKVYISWNGLVLLSHTDQSTIHLLRNLLQKKLPVEASVALIGRDPEYQSELDYYPDDAGGYVIPDIVGSLTQIIQTKCVFFGFGDQKYGWAHTKGRVR